MGSRAASWVALSAFTAGSCMGRSARANPMDAPALKLDSEAMGEYVANNVGNAERKVREALAKCGRGGCSAHVMAQIQRDLGIVYAGGMNKPAEGKAAFVEALKAEATIVLPKLLASAEVQKAFDEAKLVAALARGGKGAPAPPGEPPAPEPLKSPPPPIPEAIALTKLSDARWTSGMGFVREGEASPIKAPANAPESITVPALPSTSRNNFFILLGLGYASWAPGDVNLEGGRTAPVVASSSGGASTFQGILLDVTFGHEWRGLTRWVAPRIDGGGTFGLGFGGEGSPLGAPNATKNTLLNAGLNGHVGVDATPLPFVGVGPLVGYRWNFYNLNSGSAASSEKNPQANSTDSGFEYGVHARLRTKEHAGGPPSTFFFDMAFAQRTGQLVSAPYASAMAAILLGPNGHLHLRLEKRLSTPENLRSQDLAQPSGSGPTPGSGSDDALKPAADAIAKGMPNDLALSLGGTFTF